MTSKLTLASHTGSILAAALLSLALGEGCSAGSSGNGPGPEATGGIPSGGGAPAGGGGSGNTGTGGGIVATGGVGPVGGGGFNAGTDPNRNQVPPGQVCERVSTIQCAGETFCCSAPGRSYDDCKATTKQGCIDQLYLDAIASNPVTGYDEAGAAAIFTEYERRASICDTTVVAWGATIEGLRGLPKGTLSSGQSCQPPLTMLTNKPVAAAYLASCMNPATTACYPTAITWTCSPRGNPGTKCFADTNCNDGNYCDNPNFALTGGTCQGRKAEGAPCTLPTECQSLLCKHSVCAPATQDNVYCLSAN